MAIHNPISAGAFQPLHENVFVTDLDSGMHVTTGGIIRVDDDMAERGIRPRWAKVWAVGPEVTDIKPGEWIYIEHARWTNAIDMNLASGKVKVWRVEYPKSVLLASKEDPREAQYSGKIQSISKIRY